MLRSSLVIALVVCSLPISVGVCSLVACEVPTPSAPGQPIGDMPRWGQSFGTQPASSGSALLGGPSGANPTSPSSSAPAANAAATPSTTAADKDGWSQGDAQVGQAVWTSLCARCHGARGEGGSMPGAGVVPALADAAWQARMSDGDIASVIAHGRKGMPSFMGELSKDQIRGVIAFIRTLRR